MTYEERKKIYRNTFNSHDGKLCLKDLIQTFQECRLFDEEPNKMSYRVGQFELVQLLKDLSRGDNDE